jgi:SAM-dependent methyltransferase
MNWDQQEIETLSPILEQIREALEPLEDKEILVLCSAAGQLAFWLAERMVHGHLTGLECDAEMLSAARLRASEEGLDYLCEATPCDFRDWMAEAGLREVEAWDCTALVRQVWERRCLADTNLEHHSGYHYLLDDPQFCLGASLFNIYIRGRKPSGKRRNS